MKLEALAGRIRGPEPDDVRLAAQTLAALWPLDDRVVGVDLGGAARCRLPGRRPRQRRSMPRNGPGSWHVQTSRSWTHPSRSQPGARCRTSGPRRSAHHRPQRVAPSGRARDIIAETSVSPEAKYRRRSRRSTPYWSGSLRRAPGNDLDGTGSRLAGDSVGGNTTAGDHPAGRPRGGPRTCPVRCRHCGQRRGLTCCATKASPARPRLGHRPLHLPQRTGVDRPRTPRHLRAHRPMADDVPPRRQGPRQPAGTRRPPVAERRVDLVDDLVTPAVGCA